MITSSLSRTHLDQINFGKAFVVAGSLNIEDGDNVFVVKVSEQLHLTQRSQTEHRMVEWCNLFDRNLLARGLVDGRAIQY
jgi:hypothetical protein